jgi:hypothetical protein
MMKSKTTILLVPEPTLISAEKQQHIARLHSLHSCEQGQHFLHMTCKHSTAGSLLHTATVVLVVHGGGLLLGRSDRLRCW